MTPLARLLRLSLSILPPPPRSTLFPYTTLFRSLCQLQDRQLVPMHHQDRRRAHKNDHREREQLTAIAHSRQRSEEHTSELQSRLHLVCRLLLEKKNTNQRSPVYSTVSVRTSMYL